MIAAAKRSKPDRGTLLVLGVIAVSASCMSNPSNHQAAATKTDAVQFGGYTPFNWAVIDVQYFDKHGSSWVTFGSIPSDQSPITDSAGEQWYMWNASVGLSAAGWYTRPGNGDPRRMVQQVRAVMDGTDPNPQNDLPMDSFEADAVNCALNYTAINDIIRNCKSPDSPVVTLEIPCGRPGQIACTGDCGADIGEACQPPCDDDYTSTVRDGVCFLSAAIGLENAQPSDVELVVPSNGSYAYARNANDLGSLAYGRQPRPEANPFPTSIFFRSGGPPHQDVTVFEFPFGYGPKDQGGTETVNDVLGGSWPCLPAHFTTVTADDGDAGGMSGGVPSGHVVRYVHGSCSHRVDWLSILEPITTQITAQVVKKGQDVGFTVTEDFDLAQPHFRSRGNDLQWGFMIEASYWFKLSLLNAHLTINPAYALGIRPADGLLSVTALAENVVVIPQRDDVKQGTQNALKTIVPNTLESIVNQQMEQPVARLGAILGLPAALVPAACTAGAALETNQQECYGPIHSLLTAPPVPLPPQTMELAQEIDAALSPRNFRCLGGGTCSFHPILQGVNVMPKQVELVFAPDPNASGPDHLTPLYQKLQGTLPAGATPICDPPAPAGVVSSDIATAHHLNVAGNTKCGPILH